MATAACHPPRADNAPTIRLSRYPQPVPFPEHQFQLTQYPLNYPRTDDFQPMSTQPRWTNPTDIDPLTSYPADGSPNRQQQPLMQRDDSYRPPSRVIEPYRIDDDPPLSSILPSEPNLPNNIVLRQETRPSTAPPPQSPPPPQAQSPDPEHVSSSTVRNLPVVGQPFGPESTPASSSSPALPPANPSLSRDTSMVIPIAPRPRAYVQQPTYITPPSAPNPMNVYSPAPFVQQEEVCLECAMRDEDMADVDVNSPGVWERDSDVLYEELVRREREDQMSGLVSVDPSRPPATGGRLTEPNLKFWLSINPREPTSRQQTVQRYIKSQRRLLEAEAVAHARAMREAQHLDNRMRDAYSQLRRSAYDTGRSATPLDDIGGIRIKPPQSAGGGPHTPSRSREVTLLENGMIVEHVDVKKEEREARERKRREERRARKSSRGSPVDVTSLYSVQSFTPYAESGASVRPPSRYSPSSSPKPSSIMTNPWERPNIPRAYSQASFSDIQSLASGSPRRTRFFGMKNSSTGWRSQDSLAQSGVSGSMVDMHLALHRESAYTRPVNQIPLEVDPYRQSQAWPIRDRVIRLDTPPEDKPRKKPGPLKKIWHIVKGSPRPEQNGDTHSLSPSGRHEDDQPLAPPPPLSYLVDRGPIDLIPRHATSTPTLVSSPTSPQNGGFSSSGISAPTAPSTNLPSPASSGRSGADRDVVIEGRKVGPGGGNYENQEAVVTDRVNGDDGEKKSLSGNGYPTSVDPAMRQHIQSSPSLPSNHGGMTPKTAPLPPSRSIPMMGREKSLPPLPPESKGEQLQNAPLMDRPRTMYTYDPRTMPPDVVTANNLLQPQAGFRTADGRRQSFGGISSRPNITISPNMPQMSIPLRYDEMGRSFPLMYGESGFPGGPLGWPEHMQGYPQSKSLSAATKRKSRFGIASLFGKKQPSTERLRDAGVARAPFPQDLRSLQPSDNMSFGSFGSENSMGGSLANATSRQSTIGPRTSVVSRRVVEELVDQDPEFIAYRYPSNEQRLDFRQ